MKKILKWLFIVIVVIIGIVLYARFIGTMGLTTKEYVIMDKNVPDNFDGLKIVHFSDLHYNRAISLNKVKSIVNEINDINPDIVVFTGDLIDRDAIISDNDYDELANVLGNIKSKYGKYAVIGNHDYEKDKDGVIKVFHKADFKYLENSYEIIYNKENEKIFIGGLGNVTHNQEDISKMMEYFNGEGNKIDYKIILVHEPDIADNIVKDYKVNLILAGHSHNGQIRLPIIGAIYKPPYAKNYYDNYYNLDGTNLYISSGIGVSTVNYRLFNHPSINFYRINKDN